ncbi:Acetyltransferase_(GNAT) domain-containing protein [Hexamita inflata]|uniref:Acetyltransferase_(GNAT) domain-containing protein n=1 Tax=Hexamita inflata TaxID=28002 RepID=A0ABP1HT11_9EUKA
MSYEFFLIKPDIDPVSFTKVIKLREIQERDESLTNADQTKDLAFMMRGEELVASSSIYITGNKALIQHYLVSGIVRGLGVGSVFFQNIVQALKLRNVEFIYEFAGCPSLAFWYKLGFTASDEQFEVDGGQIPVIKYIMQ